MSARAPQEHLSTSLQETQLIAKMLTKELRPGDVVTLQGTLGAGKTTFCQFLIQELLYQNDPHSEVTSPTFGLMNQYGNDEMSICHFDLYRLSSFEDFAMRGFLEYLHDEKTICFVEWPEQIINCVDPQRTWHCSINIVAPDKRIFTIAQGL